MLRLKNGSTRTITVDALRAAQSVARKPEVRRGPVIYELVLEFALSR